MEQLLELEVARLRREPEPEPEPEAWRLARRSVAIATKTTVLGCPGLWRATPRILGE